MNNLIKKYRRNQLTSAELKQLRETLDGATNEQLTQCLIHDWTDNDADETLADDVRLARIKGRLDAEMSKSRATGKLPYKILKYAAVLLLPILFFTTIYLYVETSRQLSDDVIVATDKGEKASVHLPDGTKVTLFYSSKLSYGIRSFNKSSRKVKLDGEAYFEVHKDSDHPFVIDSKGLEVKVLGTEFNLSARSVADSAELFLDHGVVSLLSRMTNKSVVLNPNDRACLDYTTGEIRVQRMVKKPLMLRQGFITFHSTPLEKVVATLEANYGCRIRVGNKQWLGNTFSGILPSNNVNEALEVLRLSYEANITRNGDEYIMH